MPRKTNYSKAQLQERIRGEISNILRLELSDPRLNLLSVTKVELTSDQAYAKVYWDSFDLDKVPDAKIGIKKVSGLIRNKLASRLDIRHTPNLTFYYDSQFEDTKFIENLLKSGAPV